MKRPASYGYLLILALLPGLLTGCDTAGPGYDVRNAEATYNTSVYDAPVFVALTRESTDSRLGLAVTTTNTASGVMICPGRSRTACATGGGFFLTADPAGSVGGMSMYLANVPMDAEDLMTFSVISHDRDGKVLGAVDLRLEQVRP